MRIFLAGIVALAACGENEDRLTDAQAAAKQNIVVESSLQVDEPVSPSVAPAAVSYKAVGTEPGWALTITRATMRYEGDYGSVTIDQPTPANFRPAPGDYAGKRLKLTISAGPCSDGMSDLVYRQTVRLVADGKTVEGCGGGTVAPDGLAGTSWTVTAITGRATGGAGYFINFATSELSAKLGCNSISGKWRRNGDHLLTTDLVQTEMGCPEPAATAEKLGSAVLGSNMRVESTGGETMRLVSEAGSIELRRAI